MLRHGKTAIYTAGASETRARPFSKMASLVFTAIGWARDTGASTFDLGGVPLEEDADEKRSAIARFKYDFAETRVRLVRAHARWM